MRAVARSSLSWRKTRQLRPLRRRQQQLVGQLLEEAGPQPRLVRRVLQQPPHQVGHAGDHFSQRHVVANPHAAAAERHAQRIGHAIEVLHFDGRLRQIVLLQQRQRVGERTDVVRADGQSDASFAGPSRRRRQQAFGHLLETGVGLAFLGPDGDGPAHALGVDHFVVPVGALDQPHGHLPPGPPRPGDDPLGVGHAALQIRLQGQSGRKVVCLAATLEQCQGQILQGALLHVEVHEHLVPGGRRQDRPQDLGQRIERAFEIDRVGPRKARWA